MSNVISIHAKLDKQVEKLLAAVPIEILIKANNELNNRKSKMILNHQFTNSSMLASATYDTEEKLMTLEFNGGKTYTYEDVDINDYNGLISAKSAGGYFASMKKNLKVKK